MKLMFQFAAVAWAFCSGSAEVVLGANAESDGSWVRNQFREVDTLMANPGQGWMSQQRTPRIEPRFPTSVVYVRFNWADVEPEPGHYNWKILDDVIATWKPRHAAIAFRVMTCNAHSSGYYSSPKWLFDAGCKGFEYVVGGDDPTSGGARIPRVEPDYADPVYLARHDEFIKALGQRYDGSPDLDFLDIGSYGVWGEWHTSHPAPVPVRKRIVDLFRRAFGRTPLVFMSDDTEVLSYALAFGIGLRRDGVGSPWHEQNWIGSQKYAGVQGMADAWTNAPVVFEWFGNYDYLQSKNWSFEAAINFMLRNHVCLINDNIGRVPPEGMGLLEKLTRLAGARFVLRELVNLKQVNRGDQVEVKMNWANVGVGKVYRPYRLRLFLLNAAGRECFVADGQADPRRWLPGEWEVVESFEIPTNLASGNYVVAIALEDPDRQREPFHFAIDAPESKGRYPVSKLQIN